MKPALYAICAEIVEARAKVGSGSDKRGPLDKVVRQRV
jgi:hypothetical protein